VGFAAVILCVASQRVFIVLVYFVIDSVRNLLDIPSYIIMCTWECGNVARRRETKTAQNRNVQKQYNGTQAV
jgi:hypothetical protein